MLQCNEFSSVYEGSEDRHIASENKKAVCYRKDDSIHIWVP